MEVLSLLLGIVFWPAGILAYLLYCRRRNVKPRRRTAVLVALVGLPMLAAASMSKYMFLDEPLYFAAADGNAEEVKRLLSWGSNSNAEFNGHSALNVAATNGHAEVVRTLLAHGARTDLRDDRGGATPLESARMNGHLDIAAMLSKAGAAK